MMAGLPGLRDMLHCICPFAYSGDLCIFTLSSSTTPNLALNIASSTPRFACQREVLTRMKTQITFARYLCTFALAMSLSGCWLDEFDKDSNGATPMISLTNPANVSTIETPDIIINLSGTAESQNEIESVTWGNDRGGEGTANGRENWATGNIVLQTGINNITITAKDVLGNSNYKSIAVNRESPEGPWGNGSATLSWTAPTERINNSPLPDLAGYRIHYGQESGNHSNQVMIDNPGITTYVVDNLSSGTWYFAVSAFDSTGQISDLSNEGQRSIPQQ